MESKQVLMWSERKQESTKQSAWYDHTFYRVPVIVIDGAGQPHPVEKIDCGAIHSGLNKVYAKNSLFGSAVGGFCSCSSVSDNGDSTATVEILYHIGD